MSGALPPGCVPCPPLAACRHRGRWLHPRHAHALGRAALVCCAAGAAAGDVRAIPPPLAPAPAWTISAPGYADVPASAAALDQGFLVAPGAASFRAISEQELPLSPAIAASDVAEPASLFVAASGLVLAWSTRKRSGRATGMSWPGAGFAVVAWIAAMILVVRFFGYCDDHLNDDEPAASGEESACR